MLPGTVASTWHFYSQGRRPACPTVFKRHTPSLAGLGFMNTEQCTQPKATAEACWQLSCQASVLLLCACLAMPSAAAAGGSATGKACSGALQYIHPGP